jgi:hypothetical protein
VGFPGRPKSATRALVADYQAAGLQLACICENDTTDPFHPELARGYAYESIWHMTACGLPRNTPIEPAADRHLTAANLITAVDYQRRFRACVQEGGWVGPIGAYGFSEYTRAVTRAGLADWTHVAGSASTVLPTDTFWQDNTRRDHPGGVEVDINYQYHPITPLAPTTQGEDTMDRITLPAGTTVRYALTLPVSRQAEVTIGVDGTATLMHGFGWTTSGGNGFDVTSPIPDRGAVSFRPPRGTGKVDLQYTSDAEVHVVVDYV